LRDRRRALKARSAVAAARRGSAGGRGEIAVRHRSGGGTCFRRAEFIRPLRGLSRRVRL